MQTQVRQSQSIAKSLWELQPMHVMYTTKWYKFLKWFSSKMNECQYVQF